MNNSRSIQRQRNGGPDKPNNCQVHSLDGTLHHWQYDSFLGEYQPAIFTWAGKHQNPEKTDARKRASILVNVEEFVDSVKVRLDIWLWAARFFKTRSRAKEAIDGGKVHIGGFRGKPGKGLQIGDKLTIRQGGDEKVVIVEALSARRLDAPAAQLLYRETQESIDRRLLLVEQRKAAGDRIRKIARPSKKDRRQIHKFRDQNS